MQAQAPDGAAPGVGDGGGRASGASRVAGGMLVSRLFGFVREAAVAAIFGAGPHADVFRTALRGPNLLQNLLGEQTLSAAFIPVYSRLLQAGRAEDAGRFAGAIFGLLLAVAGALSLAGMVLAEPIVALLSSGYLLDAERVAAGTAAVDRFPLAVGAVRIIFPMAGLLVLSAWALAVLNSHRRFFLPYFAPVLWNAAIIAALWATGRAFLGEPGGVPPAAKDRILVAACVGALVGGALQFLVQLPVVARVLRGFRLAFSTRVAGVAEALRAFAPQAAGRGALQLSAYLDLQLASLLTAGAQGALGWAQILYLLPVSLFGSSVAVAELPELSREAGGDRSRLVSRLDAALGQMGFLTVPTVVGYLGFGFLLVGGIYRRGDFGVEANWLVYLLLCGYTLGLLAGTTSRLLQNAFYALGDTRRPARIAVERVVLSAVLGAALMFWLDRFPVAEVVGLTEAGGRLRLGAVGLALGAGLASWYELARLWRTLAGQLPGSRLPFRAWGRLSGLALAACAPALGVWWLAGEVPLLLRAVLVVGSYAAAYLALARWAGLSRLDRWLGKKS